MVKEQDSDLADLLRGDAALLDAAKKGDLDRVRKLLTPENINCRDEHGRNSTPLHLAGEQMYMYMYNVCVRYMCSLHWLTAHHYCPSVPGHHCPLPVQLGTTTWTWWSTCWTMVLMSIPETRVASFHSTMHRHMGYVGNGMQTVFFDQLLHPSSSFLPTRTFPPSPFPPFLPTLSSLPPATACGCGPPPHQAQQPSEHD